MQCHVCTRFCMHRRGRDSFCNAGVSIANKFIFSCRLPGTIYETHVSHSYQNEHCVCIRSPNALK